MSPAERDELATMAEVMRALGLASGDFDLGAALDRLTSEAVVGSYRPDVDASEASPEPPAELLDALFQAGAACAVGA